VKSAGTLLPFVILLLAFWLLIVRPARMRARQQQQLQGDLAPGLEVMTTSGLHGTVSAIEDDVIVLEIAPGVTTRWNKGAVARVTPAPALDDVPDDDATEHSSVVDVNRPDDATAIPDAKRAE
jgi:preprotein translocase subunit YajC